MRALINFGRPALLFLSLVTSAIAQQELDFTGSVKNGESFRRSIGHGLVFVLAPYAAGYTMSIEPADGEREDFSNCVTPPFHGPNPRSLLSWQFRDAKDNRLPHDRVAKNREFKFVTNRADQKKACAELSEALYGGEKKERRTCLRVRRL